MTLHFISHKQTHADSHFCYDDGHDGSFPLE